MLRFVTLIPVVLSVAAVLKLGTASIDQTLSARPLAIEIASVETHQLPLAVYGVSREMEYGLTFYRNQTAVRYEVGKRPRGGTSAGGSVDLEGECREANSRTAGVVARPLCAAECGLLLGRRRGRKAPAG